LIYYKTPETKWSEKGEYETIIPAWAGCFGLAEQVGNTNKNKLRRAQKRQYLEKQSIYYFGDRKWQFSRYFDLPRT